MCAVKTKYVQIAAAIWTLVLAAAAQDALPAVAGVKLPLLAGVALFAALTYPRGAALLLATAAGLLADALTGLPPSCATAFLALAALALSCTRANARDLPRPVAGAVALGATAVGGEIWYTLAGVSAGGTLVLRLCSALPLGLATGAGLFAVLDGVLRHIGLADGEAA